ncbi:MAG: UvrD-helicase domain-containing protein [Candidatus Humimicrobiaceae bacterium]
MNKNKLMIAAAGSGKTTFLVKKAKEIKEDNILITTYTETNEAEIRNKFRGFVPKNITIQTWFSFLLQHGVRPYQSIMNYDLHEKKIGFYLTEGASGTYLASNGKIYSYGEDNNFFKFYFTKSLKIYSDKISKFIIECNRKTNGEIVERISRIFQHIYIDEIQDLAGWDLEILKLLFKTKSSVLMVGDPRQVTYLTHHPKKHKKYQDGKIKEFIENECIKKVNMCDIDETSLNRSHRNNKAICSFSSALYPNYKACEPCECEKCREVNNDHQGIFLVKSNQVKEYCKEYKVQKLYYQKAIFPDLNYGNSKGLSFERILIYPTDNIRKYLKEGNSKVIETIKAKFYVALTRAKYSVGIVYDYDDSISYIDGLKKYI